MLNSVDATAERKMCPLQEITATLIISILKIKTIILTSATKKKLQTFIENHTLAVRLFYPVAGGEFVNFPSTRMEARSTQLDLNAPRGQVSGSGETFRAVRTLVSERVPSFFMFSRPSYRRWDGGP